MLSFLLRGLHPSFGKRLCPDEPLLREVRLHGGGTPVAVPTEWAIFSVRSRAPDFRGPRGFLPCVLDGEPSYPGARSFHQSVLVDDLHLFEVVPLSYKKVVGV